MLVLAQVRATVRRSACTSSNRRIDSPPPAAVLAQRTDGETSAIARSVHHGDSCTLGHRRSVGYPFFASSADEAVRDTGQTMSVDVLLPNPPSVRPRADSTACPHATPMDPGREVIDRAAAAGSGSQHTPSPTYVIGLRRRLCSRHPVSGCGGMTLTG